MKLIENDAVNSALVKLVHLQGLEVGSVTPRALNNILQEVWVKAKDGKFRAQLGGRFPTEEELTFLRQLGAEAIPINFDVKYGGTLLLGATLKAVTRRVWFMNYEENRVDFKMELPQPICLLGSHRPLDPKQEMPEHVPAILKETNAYFFREWVLDSDADDWPKHELAMMRRVCRWIGIKRWQFVWVHAPDMPKPDGSGNRPANTAETVKEWLKVANPGHYLVVSSQPFCENQKMAVERAVRETGKEGYGYTFDVCGPEAPPLPLSRWLDNLAKQLWEEVQLLPK